MTFYDRYELKITGGNYGSIMIIYIKLIPVKCLVFHLSGLRSKSSIRGALTLSTVALPNNSVKLVASLVNKGGKMSHYSLMPI